MPKPVRSANLVSFDVFEVDLRAQELYKGGHRIKLQIQPFQVLAMMLERPGEVVTREEMQKRLWPADTFVDFDHSVNTAIKKLRQALGDDKNKPRFVETLPKRGYRFLATVKGPEGGSKQAGGSATSGAAAVATARPESEASPWVGRVAKLACEKGHPFAVLAADAPTAAERQKLDGANDDVGLSLLIAAQKLIMVPDGTPLRILEVEQELSRCQARILEGEHYGKTALVPLQLLAESPELNAIRGPRQWSLGN
jgi:DNA-binding winged helix-turn-helix (wHTH) protein